MAQKRENYILQYKVLFLASWIILYLIFPAWISSHSVFTDRVPNMSYPLARSLVMLGFITYFAISAYLMNIFLNSLTIDKPLIIKIHNWDRYIKDNIGLVFICCISLALHLFTLFSVVVVAGGGEIPYIRQTLFIYDSLNSFLNGLFNIPVTYFFWSMAALLILLLKQKKKSSFISDYTKTLLSADKTVNLKKVLFIFSMFIFFNFYSRLFPYYSWDESLTLLRYPPVSKFLYIISYSGFGVSHIGPRIVQLILHILSAVYLYRTIYLFREKETALTGVTIYLFSPLIFSYSSRAALESGVVFFIILIAYYFLRFVKYGENRDLILTAYFIGIGFLYKQVILVMFIICFTYLFFSRIVKRDSSSTMHFKILLLSLIQIVPFFMIGKIGGTNFYEPEWSNLISLNKLIAYFLMIQSQISWIIFILFLFSSGFIISTKRDSLSLFFGLLFMGYYLFYIMSGAGIINHRYSMAIYPAIAVFSAQSIFDITQRIRWKNTFKLFFSILTIYLVIICLIPRSSSSLITFKYKDFESQYYPVDKATDWIRNRTKNSEKILSLFMTDYEFYVERIYANRTEINPKRFIHADDGMSRELSFPLENLIQYCRSNDISYIIFPYSPKNSLPPIGSYKAMAEMTEYLKENAGSEFTEVAMFSSDDNYIVVFKMRATAIL